MTFRLITLGLWLASSWTIAAEPTEDVVIPWTVSPPALKDDTSDSTWQEAAKLTGFRGLLIPDASSDSVKMAFDARYLYLYWTVTEQSGAASGNDSVEFQVFPQAHEDAYTIFRFSRNGSIKADSSTKGSLPVFKTKSEVRQLGKGWSVTARIAFSDLGGSAFFGTPNHGDKWRVCLFEKLGKPSQVLGWLGKARPDEHSVITFNKEGALPESGAAKIAVSTPLSLKESNLKIDITGSRTALSGKVVVYRDGQAAAKEEFTAAKPTQAEETEAAARATSVVQQVKVPIRLAQPGSYRITVEIADDAQCLYYASAEIARSDAQEELPDLSSEVTDLTRKLSQESEPKIVSILKEFQNFAEETGRVRVQMKESDRLPQDQWDTVSTFAETFPKRLTRLRFDANLAGLLASLPIADRKSFAVGSVSDAAKVYPDSRYQGPLNQTTPLSAAGGETVSFQLVLLPFWKALKDVRFTVTPLTSTAGATIPAEQVHWHRVGYVELETPPAWAKVRYERTIEPDVLLPAGPVAVKEGSVMPIWFDVRVPADTPAGVYRGTISVHSEEDVLEIPLEVRVYGFSLPVKGSLETDFWFMPSNLQRFYPGREYTPAVYEKDASLLESYRISSFPIDFALLAPKVKIFDEGEGRFTFDWSGFDPYVKIALAHGSNALWASLSCNSGWTYYLNDPETPVTVRATGQARKIADYMGKIWNELGENDWFARLYGQSMFQNPVYLQFLKGYVAHLQELGVADHAYYELFDEAGHMNTEQRWPAMIRHHEFFKKNVPELRLLNFGINPTQNFAGRDAVGITDVWAPHLFQLADDRVVSAIHERQAKGDNFWFYACTQKTEPEGSGNFSPFQYYHQTYLALRIQPWMAWRYGANGFLTYCLTLYYPKSWGPGDLSRWPEPVWSDLGHMGEGVLVYPGQDGTILPSMRLANVRRGLQDYEYFSTLKTLQSTFSEPEKQAYGKQVEGALAVGPELIRSPYEWTKDADMLERRRIQIAELIEAISKYRRAAKPGEKNAAK